MIRVRVYKTSDDLLTFGVSLQPSSPVSNCLTLVKVTLSGQYVTFRVTSWVTLGETLKSLFSYFRATSNSLGFRGF